MIAEDLIYLGLGMVFGAIIIANMMSGTQGRLKKICNMYFSRFSKKDIEQLALLFDEGVVLRDWEISASGKDNVIKANQKIFDSVDTIQVTPLVMYSEDDVVVAELEILVDNKVKIYVTDVITFNGDKISSIRAYKG